MKEHSRFISGEDIAAVARWDFAAVDTHAMLLAAQTKARDEAAEKALAEVHRQEGFADGFAQGRAHAALEAQNQINQFVQNQGEEAARGFGRLFEATQAQLAASGQVIAQGVLELACELARQVLRQELSVNPNVLQPVIREALDLLIADNKGATVRLNPLDFEMLHDVLHVEFAALSLSLRSDPTIARGGCVVESAGTVIDGSLEKRWLRAVANLGLDVAWEAPGHAE